MGYWTYVARRTALILVSLAGLVVLIFLISRVLPADPARLALGPYVPESAVIEFRERHGLNEPVYVQFIDYVSGLLQGDWGDSLRTRRSVLTDLAERLPATLELTTAAMALALIIGVPLGAIAGVRRGVSSGGIRFLSLFGVSMPEFWSGIMLQLVVAFSLGWLPAIGRFPLDMPRPPHITGLLTLDSILSFNGGALLTAWAHLLLPAVVLSLPTMAQVTRLMWSSMAEEKARDYTLFARANGLPESLIVYKYMLKNAFSSTLTIVGLSYGFLLGGAFIVESVFAWPGMGSYGVNAILFKDFDAIVGVTLVVGIGFAIINLAVDLLYGYLDPRIKYV